jgi:hypothetical protein
MFSVGFKIRNEQYTCISAGLFLVLRLSGRHYYLLKNTLHLNLDNSLFTQEK